MHQVCARVFRGVGFLFEECAEILIGGLGRTEKKKCGRERKTQMKWPLSRRSPATHDTLRNAYATRCELSRDQGYPPVNELSRFRSIAASAASRVNGPAAATFILREASSPSEPKRALIASATQAAS